MRKAKLQPSSKDVWLSKAQAISKDGALGDRGKRLSALINIISNPDIDPVNLSSLFSDKQVLTSARLAYSKILFERGNTQDALVQASLALDACMDCPYVYRRVATAQMVLGQVQEGFNNFSQITSSIFNC